MCGSKCSFPDSKSMVLCRYWNSNPGGYALKEAKNRNIFTIPCSLASWLLVCAAAPHLLHLMFTLANAAYFFLYFYCALGSCWFLFGFTLESHRNWRWLSKCQSCISVAAGPFMISLVYMVAICFGINSYLVPEALMWSHSLPQSALNVHQQCDESGLLFL